MLIHTAQFLHADMAYTLAKYVCARGSVKGSASLGFNVTDFEYHEPVVKQRDTDAAQPLLITAEADFTKMEVKVRWYNPAKKLWYAHATVLCEDTTAWLSDWSRHKKLVSSRVDDLTGMAAAGRANKLTTDLAYSLFSKLVGYSQMYQTMQWVILNADEAVAEVVYPEDTSGTWTVPPHFIDGVASLSGFILNGGTHYDNKNNFFITPSWKSMRFARPLAPGGRYLAYVAMVPGGDGHSFVGDVYVVQGAEIVGVVEAIKFLQWPRVMLNRFFSPPEPLARPPVLPLLKPGDGEGRSSRPAAVPSSSLTPPCSEGSASPPTPALRSGDEVPMLTAGSTPPPTSLQGAATPVGEPSPPAATDITSRALHLIAEELAVDIGLLTDEAEVADLGLDSLMSLVMSTRLREELAIEMRDAFFLEISTVGDLKKMLR